MRTLIEACKNRSNWIKVIARSCFPEMTFRISVYYIDSSIIIIKCEQAMLNKSTERMKRLRYSILFYIKLFSETNVSPNVLPIKYDHVKCENFRIINFTNKAEKEKASLSRSS